LQKLFTSNNTKAANFEESEPKNPAAKLPQTAEMPNSHLGKSNAFC